MQCIIAQFQFHFPFLSAPKSSNFSTIQFETETEKIDQVKFSSANFLHASSG